MSASENQTQPSKIPKTDFIDDVDAYMKKQKDSTENCLRSMQELHGKYKYFQSSLNQRKLRLKDQIPDIKSNLDVISELERKRDAGSDTVETQFLLSESVYAKADVKLNDKIMLWLGANIMLEYSVDDAKALLEKNLATATSSLASVETDSEFLRDQMTTIEVNMARVYNWDVEKRRAEKNA